MKKKFTSQNRRAFLRKAGVYTASTLTIPPFLATFFSGCKKDFLNRSPLDGVPNEDYWQTKAQIELAVNACYDSLKGKNATGGSIDYENLGDNTIYPPQSDYQAISSGNYDFTRGSINAEWVNSYVGIRRCNNFLENYLKAEAVTDAAVLKRYASEVRFMRAYLYSHLSLFFGDVPLILKTINLGDEELTAPRNKRTEIVDFVLKELDELAPALPNSYSSTDLGRITKGAALAWRARIALFYQKFDVAEAAAKAVMDLNVYQLYTNGNPATSYNELFTLKGKLSAGTNKETILARLYLISVSTHNMSRECQVPDQTSRFCPTKSLVDSYLCSDGLPIDRSPLYSEQSYDDVFKNRDPRLKQTVLAPGGTWGGLDDGDADDKPAAIYNTPKWNADKKGCITGTGYYFTKYVEPSIVGNFSQDSNDVHIIRFAEVLLTYAEARFEQGKLTQADVDLTINRLRERVGMKKMNLAELTANAMDVRTEIRRERRVELALEGQRYFDLLRWKQGPLLAEDIKGMKKSLVPEINQKYITTLPVDAGGFIIVNSGRRFDEAKNYLWPVPLIQFQRNPNLGQNPGW